MNPPHRKLHCARCGAAPHWVLSQTDGAPIALCPTCVTREVSAVPPTNSTPSASAPPTPQPARAAVSLRWAAVAVCAALVAPRSTAIDRIASRLSRASVAAVSAFTADEPFVRPGPIAVARERGLLRAGPSVTQVVAQPIAVTPTRRVDATPQGIAESAFPGALIVTPEFQELFPPVMGVRAGDLLTRINLRNFSNALERPPCTRGGEGFWVEGFRRGFPFANYVRCADWLASVHRGLGGGVVGRNVAAPPRPLLTARQWRADLPQAQSRARSTASRPLARGPWRPSFEHDGRGPGNASR